MYTKSLVMCKKKDGNVSNMLTIPKLGAGINIGKNLKLCGKQQLKFKAPTECTQEGDG